MLKTNENIPVRNIYYMLSYAYQALSLSEYQKVDVEKFHNTKDLYTEILKIGVPVLIRGGLLKDYVRISEKTTVIRGKIDINASIKQNALVDKKLMVLHDDFSEDILLNQIIKATLILICRSLSTSRDNKKIFFGLLPFFNNVSDIELDATLWKRVHYNRQNIRYQFIIDICRYLYEELLLGTSLGKHDSKQIQDEQRFSSLYEKFVFAFYKRETGFIVTHPQIPWKVDNGFTEALPIMQTDIVLSDQNKTLIIDTKFYSENMATKFAGSNAKQKSANLYQLFTYVNNWHKREDEEVGGMLLYAKTTAKEQPNHHYEINGNRISVVTLDMNQKFEKIKNELLMHAESFFKTD